MSLKKLLQKQGEIYKDLPSNQTIKECNETIEKPEKNKKLDDEFPFESKGTQLDITQLCKIVTETEISLVLITVDDDDDYQRQKAEIKEKLVANGYTRGEATAFISILKPAYKNKQKILDESKLKFIDKSWSLG